MATPVVAFAQLATECEADGLTPKHAERIGAELAKTFGVQPHEIGIMKVAGQNLVFMDGHAKWSPYNTYIWERSPEKEIWGHFSSPEPE